MANLTPKELLLLLNPSQLQLIPSQLLPNPSHQ
jgi:hypothetical protein